MKINTLIILFSIFCSLGACSSSSSAPDQIPIASVAYAIQTGDIDTVKDYLKNGGSPNAFHDRMALLHHAIYRRQPTISKLLIDAGCYLNIKDKLK